MYVTFLSTEHISIEHLFFLKDNVGQWLPWISLAKNGNFF